jgi:ABC-type nitrate/sulfonate/bicarbonate transport system permease component
MATMISRKFSFLRIAGGTWIRVLGILSLFVIWWAVGKWFTQVRYILATPQECFQAFLSSLACEDFWADVLLTLWRAAIGFFLGALIGIPLGILLGRNKWLMFGLELPVDFARSIPVSALFPAFVLWLGIGSRSQIAAAAFGCTMTFIVNVMYGVRSRRVNRENFIRSLGASEWQVLTKVLLWDISSPMLSAARLSLSTSLVLIVVTEMLSGGSGGLGQRIQDFRLAYKIPEMWVSIFTIGLIGLGLNRVLAVLERRVVHWQGH